MINGELKLETKDFVFVTKDYTINKIKDQVKEIIYYLTDFEYRDPLLDEFGTMMDSSKLDKYMKTFEEQVVYDKDKIDFDKVFHFIKKAIYDSCENDDYYIKLDIKDNKYYGENNIYGVISVAKVVEN